jgi:VanZ family protein
MRSILSRWLPVLIWVTVIFFASANPDPYKALPYRWIEPCFSASSSYPSCAELVGRVLHISEYAVLALLTARAMFQHENVTLANLVLVLGLTELYALSDEIHQLFVPGRSFQLMDLGLDLFGGVIGLIIYRRIRAKRRRT